MPTLAKTPFGVITGLWGTAVIRQADGKLHMLHVGDKVHEGDQILTAQDGIVQITDPQGGVLVAKAAPGAAPLELDRVIQGLNTGDPQVATAAGLAGGDGSGLSEGLRVERISEALFPADPLPQVTIDATPATPLLPVTAAAASAAADAPAPAPAPAPTITVSAPHLTNDPQPTIDGTTNQPAGTDVTLHLTDAAGSVQTVHATVQPDGSFSAVPPSPLAEGTFSVVSTVRNADGASASAGDSGVLDVTPPTLAIALDVVAGDGIVNAAEAAGVVAITGTASGDVKSGDTVTLSVDGKTYTGALDATLHFSIGVPGSTLAADTHVQASISAVDGAGNSATASATQA